MRVYHRASGTPIDPSIKGQALAVEVARLDALMKKAPARAGTFAGLLESYKRAPRFMELAERTKADYRKIMDWLEPIGGTPLVECGPGFIAKLRDRALRAKRAGFTNHMLDERRTKLAADALVATPAREARLEDRGRIQGLGVQAADSARAGGTSRCSAKPRSRGYELENGC